MKKAFFFIGVLAIQAMANKADFFDGVDEASKPVMDAARKRIEEIRKGGLQVTFTDESGAPVSTRVKIRLLRHAFSFGASLLQIQEQKDPIRKVALEVVDELFNTVTVCGYWNTVEKQKGSPDWTVTDADLNWTLEHHKIPRFHAIIYTHPSWFKDITTLEEWWRVYESRIKSVAVQYGDKIQEFDVLNEMILDQHGPKRRAVIDVWPHYPVPWDPANGVKIFEITRKYLPGAKLVLLEADVATEENRQFQEIVAYFKAAANLGAPFDYSGHQAHFYSTTPFQQGSKTAGANAFTMKKLEGGLRFLASVGKPVVITEYSPPSRSTLRPHVESQPRLSDAEIAAWSVNYYTLVFSQPYVRGLTRWFVIDNLGGYGVDAGLVTKTGDKKPEYFALRKLLKETWNTDWTGPIQDGQASFRGFYGTYQVLAEGYQPAKFSCSGPGETSAKVVLYK